MRTFWDQVVDLVEQGEAPRQRRPGDGGRRIGDQPRDFWRDIPLAAHFEEVARALDQLERMRGVLQGFLSRVSEAAAEFDSRGASLEEVSAKVAALTQERDRLAERCARLETMGASQSPR